MRIRRPEFPPRRGLSLLGLCLAILICAYAPAQQPDAPASEEQVLEEPVYDAAAEPETVAESETEAESETDLSEPVVQEPVSEEAAPVAPIEDALPVGPDESGSGEASARPFSPEEEVVVPIPKEAKPPLSMSDAVEANTELTPAAVLQNSPAFQRLLGENPAFVYDPGSSIDPMLIPWTRARVMYDELKAIAEQAIELKNWPLAETALQRILSDLAATPQYLEAAEVLMSRLETLRAEEFAAGPGAGKAPEARLPKWVKDNTRGVLYDDFEPMVLVGPYMLKVGDRVPQQLPEVVVAKIERTTVHYRVFDKTFPVQLNVQEGE